MLSPAALQKYLLFTAALIFTLNPVSMPAQTLNVLHNFGIAAGDGDIPYANVTMDSAGNIYGTTLTGGAHGLGSVYRLAPGSNGRWKETILYSFKGGSTDGASPHAKLFLDSQGNLFSTTLGGGPRSKSCTGSASGCGVVFELAPQSNGQYRESVLHFFTGSDGSSPYAGLTPDSAGNFYGAATGGGSKNAGVVYKLSFNGTAWTETVLHSFAGGSDGKTPYGDLAFDAAGNLYGTTYAGGSARQGVVYQLSPQSDGTWTEKILHTFLGNGDGAETFAGVVLDSSGNVFGTTVSGGSFNYGTVFELKAANNYASSVLHSFNLDLSDGTFPNGLIFDKAGDLLGTTSGAGQNDGNGTIFELTPSSSGWTENVLFTFQGAKDGTYPDTALLMDGAGNLYGATIWGGTAGDTNGGVVFQFVP